MAEKRIESKHNLASSYCNYCQLLKAPIYYSLSLSPSICLCFPGRDREKSDQNQNLEKRINVLALEWKRKERVVHVIKRETT